MLYPNMWLTQTKTSVSLGYHQDKVPVFAQDRGDIKVEFIEPKQVEWLTKVISKCHDRMLQSRSFMTQPGPGDIHLICRDGFKAILWDSKGNAIHLAYRGVKFIKDMLE